MNDPNPQTNRSSRIVSIDLCRGYAIVLMIGGNFAGHFDFMPAALTHHAYGLSFAETVAPVFFLLVGANFRMSMLRRIAAGGLWKARRRAIRRYLIIMALGFVVYYDHLWDALTHIGMGGLLALPVIHLSQRVRLATAASYLIVFQAISLWTDYGDWMVKRENSLNGGPLGALSWAAIILLGSILADLLASKSHRKALRGCVTWGIALAAAGLILTPAWPGLKAAWPFTRYGMTAPFPIFTAGLAFLTYALFYGLSEVLELRLPFLGAFGANPIVMFLLAGVMNVVSILVMHYTGQPDFFVSVAAWIVMLSICYGCGRMLIRRKMYLHF